MNGEHSKSEVVTSNHKLSTPVYEHLNGVESWDNASKDARIAFYGAMKGKAYGHEPTRSAWDWFLQGWDIRPAHETADKQWRCFHCDEMFTTQVDAENHFGRYEHDTPACVIKASGEFALLRALRNAESQLLRYHSEDSDVMRAMASMQSDHIQALSREEEKGYARGVRDARAMPSVEPSPGNPAWSAAQNACDHDFVWNVLGGSYQCEKCLALSRTGTERPAVKASGCVPGCTHSWTVTGRLGDPRPEQLCNNGCGLMWKDRFSENGTGDRP